MKNTSQLRVAIRRLCEGAVLIALAEILSMLPLFKMPWSGSVDLGMLPIFIFCIRWGFGPGMLVSFAHGFLQILSGGGFAIGWETIVGDYLLAYAVLGICGLFSRRPGGFYLGSLAGCGLRFLVHYIVGATLWAKYMPESFFGMTMTTPWLYSALYNGVYMLLDCAAVLLVGFLLKKTPARRYLEPYC